MRGLMMDRPLLTTMLLRHGVSWNADQEIVTQRLEGDRHRHTYRDAYKRICKLAHALVKMGVRPGDRVGTVALNTYRHFELYYAVAGIGAVCHTINPLLGPNQMAYVIKDAEDKVIFFDFLFSGLLDGIAGEIGHVERFISLGDPGTTPKSEVLTYENYEELIAGEPEDFDWPDFDENEACGLCYTSGTTGHPKGVLYSHRSQVIHAFAGALPDAVGANSDDVVLPVVPMFHVNAWGTPYTTMIVGAKLVLPGLTRDGPGLVKLFNEEKVTLSLGVPTVWMGVIDALKKSGEKLPHMRMTLIGGAAVPEFMIRTFEDDYGVEVRQGWGMTEMSPLGSVNVFKAKHRALPREERIKFKLKAGRPVCGVEFRLCGPAGDLLPFDGESEGHLQVRGPWVLSSYYNKTSEETLTADGWFDTGDIATIDPDGFVTITDRSKDVIKSGGEWISSVMVENEAMSHPKVARAAVIGLPHPKWQERPFLIIVPEAGETPTEDEVLDFLRGRLDKIAVPDKVAIADDLPLGATGKVLKTELRKKYADVSLV